MSARADGKRADRPGDPHPRLPCRRPLSRSIARPSPTLLESELFGHVRGAFTGALRDKPACSRKPGGARSSWTRSAICPCRSRPRSCACSGREMRRVGEPHRRVEARFISATNKDLEREVEAGRFREDLYTVSRSSFSRAPLRDRRERLPGPSRPLRGELCRAMAAGRRIFVRA